MAHAALRTFFSCPDVLECRLFRQHVASPEEEASVASKLKQASSHDAVHTVRIEHCFNLRRRRGTPRVELPDAAANIVHWLLAETFAPQDLAAATFFDDETCVVEVGPRPSFASAWSSTCVSICEAAGVPPVLASIERSRRYLVSGTVSRSLIVDTVSDRMTECQYPLTAQQIAPGQHDNAARVVPLMAHGKAALETLNQERALGLDAFDVDYYYELFVKKLQRDPTDVELYDMAQSNSEHSRHWFFAGRQVIDGVEQAKSLFQLVKEPLRRSQSPSSIIAFCDNSSAIRGGPALVLQPEANNEYRTADRVLHPLLTAETHNFPSAVAPFPGAETGAGGRIRDVQATGRGAFTCAGLAGYCVGGLPGLPGANSDDACYPRHLASPLQILLDASDGASDYGNKFGEPLVAGYCRSLATRVNGERREWIKPVMFSAGVGWLDDRFVHKEAPEAGMKVVKIGGPAYRIGLGGGSASSRVSTAGTADLDFDAVQRGDAQMCNRMNRVIRACLEDPSLQNPIVSIHDQGCGGNGNVLKEIVESAGADYELERISLGDPTLTALEIWGAEYQESNALLIRSEDEPRLRAIADRERCGLDVVGTVTGDGVVRARHKGCVVVDLPVALVLGKLPPKIFKSQDVVKTADPVVSLAPAAVTDNMPPFRELLTKVLQLPCVGSKRFLVHKVDRSVGGLVSRQQCVGPFQIPVANCAVLARSHFSMAGVAVAVGEVPQLVTDPKAMARRCVAEMLTNLCFAKVSHRHDIRLSANWMWPAKFPGEGAKMYRACEALCEALIEVEVAVDGGKDSLSMAAPDGAGGIVKSPGALALTAYANCPDIRAVLTPELKGGCALIFVDLATTRGLSGTAYAQAFPEHQCEGIADCEPRAIARAFDVIQHLIGGGLLTAGHDRSDGGLVTTLLEMCFASYCGVDVELSARTEQEAAGLYLFDEGPGLVLETNAPDVVLKAFEDAQLQARTIGVSTINREVTIRTTQPLLDRVPVVQLWAEWEATSFKFEAMQRDPACVEAERASLANRKPPTYMPCPLLTPLPGATRRHKVAVVRCEGSNGDREMAAALWAAGLAPIDVTMSDLVARRTTLDDYHGAAFVGGFSYADVCDSAKGWAASIKFNLDAQFDRFKRRSDTFSLGVCNGCQLEALLGWVAPETPEETRRPRFIHNASRKFESRWLSVTVLESPCKLLEGMAGATLGVWVAHGEGRAFFPDPQLRRETLQNNLAPLRYADDDAAVCGDYPFCPNGSDSAIAGLCSPDGRHLALMPHPERAVFRWQWPWSPPNLADDDTYSPWLRLFQNAKCFLDNNGA